jgi:ubiquinone/menaquinone biosynthesis C-methylase UbiE
LDLLGAGAFRAVSFGISLNIFETIGSNALTLQEISVHLSCDQYALEILLEFLCSLGYLKKTQSGKFQNTPLTRKWILRNAGPSFADMITVWDREVFPIWDRNAETVMKTGRPSITLYEEFKAKPDAWRSFNSFEMAIANWLKGVMLSQIKLPQSEPTKLLDIGGGHGLYSISFCQKYPRLEATIFDREESKQLALVNIASNKLQNRIRFQSGNFLSDDLGEGYDVAFLFNILHNFRKGENLIILRKVRDSLVRGGTLAIFDNISGLASPKRTVDFFSLAYLLTVGGRCYPLSEIKSWLDETGFINPGTTIKLPGFVKATRS